MSKDDERIAIAKLETRVDGHDAKFKELGEEMVTHGDALHKHGRELQGMAVYHDSTDKSLRYVNETLRELPETIKGVVAEVTAPLKETVDVIKATEDARTKRDLKIKWAAIGIVVAFKALVLGGIWAVYTVVDLLKVVRG